MINKDTYKRLTDRDIIKVCFDTWELCGLYDVCKRDCIKPEPCKIPQIIRRLAELEDKITDGTLVELPCKVGDTATAVIDTLVYDNSVQKVKIEGLAYIVKDENGDITFQHMSRLFPNEEEAEKILEEIQNE